MQSIGHPIVGDPIYGRPADRLMLHADSLAFLHPMTGEAVRLVSPVPF
jgi:tRNA pseudouridine32 synthase/23S rRNA pseudouridine746 synthase